jgi:F-type H+-transporting ATPase subunit delta
LKAVAKRYAAALADVAMEQGAAEPVKKNLADFAEAVRGSADLANLLASPSVPRGNKQAVIGKLAARMGVGKIFRNFLLLLADNRRTALLPEIAEAFDALLLERMGIAEAQVTSAAELTAAQKTELNGAMERLTGKKVQSRYRVDRGLLGGAVVRIGSTVYDGSVREQLDRLRDRLTTG